MAAIISGLLLYGKYLDVKDTLSVSNKKLLDLNEGLAQLNEENSRLNDQIDQIRDRDENLKELEGARLRISQLEDEIRLKDEGLAQLNEENSSLNDQIRQSAEDLKDLEGARLRISQLEDEIRLKDEGLAQLNEENSSLNDQIRQSAEDLKELEGARLRISQLEDEIRVKDEGLAQLNEENSSLNDQIRQSAEDLKELEGAKLGISQLEDEIRVKDQAFSRLDEQISKLEEGTKEEKRIGESLRKELLSKDAMVAALQEKLEAEKSVAKARIKELKSTYESLIFDLKRQLKDKEMTISEFEEKLSITFVDRILFDFGKATVTPEGRGILGRVGNSLKKISGMQIRVIGHTDNRRIKGEYLYKFPSNWELSSARAAAVVRFFQAKTGLDPESFEVVGRSFYRPVASNETKEGRAQNRRVEVIIAPKIR